MKGLRMLGLALVAQTVTAGLVCAQESLSTAIERSGTILAGPAQGRTVAVLDFPTLNNSLSELGAYISEELSTSLAIALQGKGKVVERRQVRQVLAEERLAAVGLTAAQLGQVAAKLGADAVVIGTLTVLGSQIVVNARLVHVSSGTILAAQRISGSGSQEVVALSEKLLEPSGRSSDAPSSQGTRRRETANGPLVIPDFENDFLRARVDAASVAPSGIRASVTITLENKSAMEEFVARHAANVRLTDSVAGYWYFDENTAGGLVQNSSCGSACWSEANYVRIPPRGRLTIVLQFIGNGASAARPNSLTGC